MQDIISTQDITHSYTVWDREEELHKIALDGISLNIRAGMFITILGANGSGKSTLARHLNALLLPDSGGVWIDGSDTRDISRLRDIRDTVGMVFQNPDNQIIGTSVEEDTAFGPENRNLPSELIRKRVAASLKAVGLADRRKTSPHRLSGGQKQRVAIAGTLAADNRCIVLDEPTAMLDPASRKEVLGIIKDLHHQGKTIILITHHTDEAADADLIILMKSGRITASGSPAEIFSRPDLVYDAGMDLPAVTDVALRLAEEGLAIDTPVLTEEDFARNIGECCSSCVTGDLRVNTDADNTVAAAQVYGGALTVSESIGFINNGISDSADGISTSDRASSPVLLSVEHISHTYGQGTINECEVLQDISFDVHEGEFIGLIGGSGAGKTTLIKHLNGLLRPDSGDIKYMGESIYRKGYRLSDLRKEVGLVFQNPEQQLFCRTVLKDVCFGPLNMGMSEEEAEQNARDSLALVGIDEAYFNLSPVDMSGGQMRRVAIAGVLAMSPKLIVMDEPAAGLDPVSKKQLFALIERMRSERGMSVVLVSHDMEDVAEYADRVLVLSKGRILMDGRPAEVFSRPDELAEEGICVPPITSAVNRLRDYGVPIRTAAATRSDAVRVILDAFREDPGKRGE